MKHIGSWSVGVNQQSHCPSAPTAANITRRRRTGSYMLWIVLLASCCALLWLVITPVSIQAADMSSLQAQEPVPNGQEVMWVNVSRFFKGQWRKVSSTQLQNILRSYRSGGWLARGAPEVDPSGQWWQKLVRTKYTSSGGLGGAGAVLTFKWVNGCPVDAYSNQIMGGSGSLCDCWKQSIYAAQLRQLGASKPAKCR